MKPYTSECFVARSVPHSGFARLKVKRAKTSAHAVRAKENSILKAMPDENFLPGGVWCRLGRGVDEGCRMLAK